MPTYTLPKHKKLKSKKAIDQLFAQGKSVRKGAVRVVYLEQTTVDNHQTGFSVSKRFFKKAVDRNRIKRLLREAYRLNQQIIDSTDDYYYLMILYQGNQLPTYAVVEQNMIRLLKQLAKTTH